MICGGPYTTAQVWKSDDTCGRLFLSLHHVGLRDQTQAVNFLENAFICWG